WLEFLPAARCPPDLGVKEERGQLANVVLQAALLLAAHDVGTDARLARRARRGGRFWVWLRTARKQRGGRYGRDQPSAVYSHGSPLGPVRPSPPTPLPGREREERISGRLPGRVRPRVAHSGCTPRIRRGTS